MAALIISGAQVGADMGGLRGAQQAGVPHLARTFRGFKPQGMAALPADLKVAWVDCRDDLTYGEKLRIRTLSNVVNSDATVVFIGRSMATSRGSLLTINDAVKEDKPLLVVSLTAPRLFNLTLLRIALATYDTVNIAGQREISEALVAAYVREALAK